MLRIVIWEIILLSRLCFITYAAIASSIGGQLAEASGRVLVPNPFATDLGRVTGSFAQPCSVGVERTVSSQP